MKGVTVDFYLLQREAVSIESINVQNWWTLVRGWALCHPTRASCDYLSSCRSSELINALNCQASRLQAQASLSSPSPALSELYRGCPLTKVALHDEAVIWLNELCSTQGRHLTSVRPRRRHPRHQDIIPICVPGRVGLGPLPTANQHPIFIEIQ